MQAILDSGWHFLSVSGFVSHLLVLVLALGLVAWGVLGKGKQPAHQLLEEFVTSHTNLQLGMLLAAFVISYFSLNHLPYPNTPLWVLLFLTWIVFPLAMAYGWLAWLGLLRDAELRKNRAFREVEFPGLFVALVVVISFFVFKPKLGDSDFLREKQEVVANLYGVVDQEGKGQQVELDRYVAELLPIIVSRWGMMFYHPKGWTRFEPDNGDGYRFTLPENDQVSITGSGIYTTVTNCDTFCTAEIDRERSLIEYLVDYEILYEGYTEKWVIADSTLVNGPYSKVLQGYEFHYTYTDGGGIRKFVHSSFSIYEGINFGVYGECPIEEKERFESLFQKANSRYFLLRDDNSSGSTGGPF